MLLIDTSVLIEYFRKTKKDETFFYKLAETHSAFCISTITKYEVLVGSNPQQDGFWQKLLGSIAVIPFDDATAVETVQIRKELKAKSENLGFEDMAIAATARQKGFQLATLNNKHFKKITNLNLVTR
ncbi:MAG: PIN domain-containing protein [Saprospiraceae bacterium]|nr:PIN domain-containing protein [Saprospiraceae bacterium]